MKIPLMLVKSEAEALETTRTCGDCVACCVLLRISADPEFPSGKPGYEPCGHLCRREDGAFGGCSIYESRPELCRSYACLWRAGVIAGDERRRPDKLGLMMVMEEIAGRPVLEVWELWDGAASEDPGLWFLRSIVERVPLAVRFYGVPASTLLTPAKFVKQLSEGKTLSALTRDDPIKVVKWLEARMADGMLEMPTDRNQEQSILADVESLRLGVPTRRHFARPTD